jgi:MFS family permease
MENQTPDKKRLYSVLAAAFLGWMFDGLEMGLFPLIARPSLQQMQATGGAVVSDAFVGQWMGYATAAFLIGAALGGVVFGWLGDRIGRVRAMSLSILCYSLFTGCLYFSTQPWHLALFRFIAALGMGGEWSLGVALVMEVWPDKSRPLMAGLIGVASNVGFASIAVVGLFFRVTVDSWRWVALVGAAPALLTLGISFFVPESEKWQHAVKSRDSRQDPLTEIFGSAWLLYCAALSGAVALHFFGGLSLWLCALIGGLASAIIAFLPRKVKADGPLVRKTLIGTALASVALIGTWGSVQWLPLWADKMTGGLEPTAKAYTQVSSALGAIAGCLLGAWVGGFISRRMAYFLLCLGSLVSCAWLFRGFDSYSVSFLALTFLVGGLTAAFYGWLPLYLPELFPTRVRATGQGIGYNAGRVLAAVGALQMGALMQTFHGSYAQAGAVITLVYAVGMVIIWIAPETKGKPLPE